MPDETVLAPPPEATVPATIPTPDELKAPSRVTFEQLRTLPDTEYRTRWMNAVVEADTARQNYAQDLALARQFATSGRFDDLTGQTPAQAIATAMVKIQFGRTWRLEPADAMRSIYFTNGRPAIENEIVASRLQSAGVEWDTEFHTETFEHKGKQADRCVGVTLWLRRYNFQKQASEPWIGRDGKQISVSFTQAEADTAMVWEKGKQIPLSQKWNFQSWPADMYYWKAIARVKKYHAPNVLRGALSQAEAFELPPPEPAPIPEMGRPEGMPPQAELIAPPPAPGESPALRRVRAQQSFLDPDDERGEPT